MVTLVGALAPCALCNISASPRTTRPLWIILTRIASPHPLRQVGSTPQRHGERGEIEQILRALCVSAVNCLISFVKLARGLGRHFFDGRQRAKSLRLDGKYRVELAADIF